jgi:integrase
MGLTVKKIARLKKKGRYRDGRNLFLQVSESGAMSWLLRYRINHRDRWLGLGSYELFSIEEARDRAHTARKLIADNVDPVEQRRAERVAAAAKAGKSITFKEAAEEYFRLNEATWQNAKSKAQFLSSLKHHAYPVLGHVPLPEIDTDLVLKVLRPKWLELTETMSRVRGRIEAVLAWGKVNGYRPSNADNPALWTGHLDAALPARTQVAKVEHHPAIDYHEMPAFMADLAKREGIAALALRFLILCASRTNEVIGARWSEVDFDEAVWEVPAERMKMKKAHRVPLPRPALDILRAMPREKGNDFIFIGARQAALSNMAMAVLLRRMKRDDISVHGMRATFRTWCGEETNIAREVAEQALAHQIPDATERAYKRGDLFERRKRLMALWAQHCTAPAKRGEVVKLRRAR